MAICPVDRKGASLLRSRQRRWGSSPPLQPSTVNSPPPRVTASWLTPGHSPTGVSELRSSKQQGEREQSPGGRTLHRQTRLIGASEKPPFSSIRKLTNSSERLLDESLMSKEGQELLALGDLFCGKMVPQGDQKRWAVRRREGGICSGERRSSAC